MSHRTAFSDGWKKALLEAGAIDLLDGTELAQWSTWVPGGLLLVPKRFTTNAARPKFIPFIYSNGCLEHVLAVRFWCLMIKDFMNPGDLANHQQMGSQLMQKEEVQKLGQKPNTPKNDKHAYKVINASRAPCQCQHRYSGTQATSSTNSTPATNQNYQMQRFPPSHFRCRSWTK